MFHLNLFCLYKINISQTNRSIEGKETFSSLSLCAYTRARAVCACVCMCMSARYYFEI